MPVHLPFRIREHPETKNLRLGKFGKKSPENLSTALTRLSPYTLESIESFL